MTVSWHLHLHINLPCLFLTILQDLLFLHCLRVIVLHHLNLVDLPDFAVCERVLATFGGILGECCECVFMGV